MLDCFATLAMSRTLCVLTDVLLRKSRDVGALRGVPAGWGRRKALL